MWGIDQLSSGQLSSLRKRLRSSPCALLTHAAAVDRNGNNTLRVLEELGVHPSVLFTPEHGMFGEAQAEESVPSGHWSPEDGPRVVSLYGDRKESLSPSEADLEGVELLLIDLVDVGSRYYTYVWTALLAARAAQAKGIHTIVLDRPNPLGTDPTMIEGKPQAEGFLSFVGLEPLPIRHGMTVGEIIAHFFNRDEFELGVEGALSVVPCMGWERLKDASAWGRPFVPPSPNMPTLETALLYPGGCLLEGTNLSEGRGTCFPFKAIGAPYVDGEALASKLREAHLPGVLFRPVAFKPSFEKHAGERCSGVMLHITDKRSFRPVMTSLTLITLAQQMYPEDFKFLDRVYEFESEVPAFDLLTGSAEARTAISDGASPNDVVELVAPVSPEARELQRDAEALLAKARV